MLTCSTLSLADVTFEWHHPNNKQLNSSLSYNGETQYNSTVVIDAVTTEDEGIYNCRAENEGGVIDATTTIYVHSKHF